MFKTIALLITMATIVATLHVSSIYDCPALNSRDSPPNDVTDLRVDDIRVFAAMGDSVLAGYGVNNINPGIFGLINTTCLTEFRGLNYLMGGDPKAITVANFMKRYNAQFRGQSIGFHELRKFQRGKPNLYVAQVDNLNAAKSAAMARDLNVELDYLINSFKNSSSLSNITPDTWKMITIHIGSNDLCNSCNPELSNVTSAEAYGDYVHDAIKNIKINFPNNTLVNLVGTFNISGLNQIASENLEYCSNRLILRLCSCLHSPEKVGDIAKLAQEYDAQLKLIAENYAPKSGNTFGVMFSPVPVDMISAPVDILSNIDCFHPSLLGHEWLAKVTWNQLFIKHELRPSIIRYDKSEKIYCPTEEDRIQVK